MKKRVLARLKQGGPVSGEELGKSLGISRAAIWKHIRELRREGYQIDSLPGQGYVFVSAPDSLLPEEVRTGLETRVLGQEIVYHRTVTSTQEVAREMAARGAREGTIILCETQSEGRGRIGRAWASPSGGVYFSIILRPLLRPTQALRLPLIAGLAVAQAIRGLTGLKPELKWPNDIIINDRKAGGILTEINAEVDRLHWIIMGIGLNVNTPGGLLPDEVKDLATSLQREQGNPISRVSLLQGILTELEQLYEDFRRSGFETARLKWKSMSYTIGKEVTVCSAAEEVTGRAVDIDSDGALIVVKSDGKRERIIAGDVTLKKNPGESDAG